MKRELTYDDYAKKLDGEYAEAYEQVKLYFSNSFAEPNVMENCMNDMTDLLLDAQAEQRPASAVVGEDIAAFCRDTLAANRTTFGKRLWRGIVTVAFFLAVIAFVEIIGLLICVIAGEDIGKEQASFVRLLVLGGVALVLSLITQMIRKLVWDHRRNRGEKLTKLAGLDLLLYLPVIFIKDLPFLGRHEFMVPLWIEIVVLLAVSLPVLLLHYFTIRKNRHEYVYLGEIDIDDEAWNSKIEALRKNIAVHNRDYKDHPLLTPIERGAFVKKMIYLRIMGFLSAAAVMIVISCWLLSVLLPWTETEVLTAFILAELVKLGIIIILVSAAIEWIRFKREFFSCGHDIMDDSLLKKLF